MCASSSPRGSWSGNEKVPATYVLICGRMSAVLWLHRSTRVRRSFRIFSRSSGQSLAWPTCTNKSRNRATWVLISIINWKRTNRKDLWLPGACTESSEFQWNSNLGEWDAHFKGIRLLLVGHISGRSAAGSSSTNDRTAPPGAHRPVYRKWKHGGSGSAPNCGPHALSHSLTSSLFVVLVAAAAGWPAIKRTNIILRIEAI